MGLFDIFKKKPKFVDDVFGELGYTTFRDKSKNFYDGTVNLNGKKMGVVIEADENGPTKLQKEFFLKFRDNYQNFKADILLPYLTDKFTKDFNDDYQIKDFDKEFELDAITIPTLPQKPLQWSICYDSIKLKHWVTINFSDDVPTGITVDG